MKALRHRAAMASNSSQVAVRTSPSVFEVRTMTPVTQKLELRTEEFAELEINLPKF